MNQSDRLYTPRFFLLFVVATFFMIGFGLQFHLGQYVEFLGGSEGELGWVLGIGVLGSLCLRPFVGRLVDRLGCRPMLTVGAGLAALAAFGYPSASGLWMVSVLRVATMMAMATYFTALIVLTARIAPPRRRAESLGTIGMGGFAGLIIGPTLGDIIFAYGTVDPKIYQVFFCVSGGSFLAATLLGCLAHDPGPPPGPEKVSGTTASVIWRHWPGLILLVGVVFPMGQTIQFSFLERMAEAREFANIKWFFLAYCPTAMLLRLVFRRLPEQFGRRRTCILGLILFGAGMALLSTAHSELGLILPAIVMGSGHCFVFPSMVDLAAEKLPPEHRGMGTSLILGAGDIGFLLGNVVWGQWIEARGYDETLFVVAGCSFAIALIYAWSQRSIVLRWSTPGSRPPRGPAA